jgi:hypothetical protein
VTSNTKGLIEEINEISRQLLSRILATQNNEQRSTLDLVLDVTQTQQTDEENKKLSKLMEQRKNLISTLFEQNSSESINSQSELLQEMVSLDNELTANAELSKKSVSNQIIEIKKSKKIAKTYQKY